MTPQESFTEKLKKLFAEYDVALVRWPDYGGPEESFICYHYCIEGDKFRLDVDDLLNDLR